MTTRGVHLDDRRIQVAEGAVHAHQEPHRAADLLAFQAQAEGDLPRMVAAQTGQRIDIDTQDLFGRPRRDLLDLHAAFGGGHHRHLAGLAIDQHAEVELARDVAAFLDIDALDLLAGLSRLLGHQDGAQHLLGVVVDLLDGLDDTHPALAGLVIPEPAGTAATGMDLGLHDPDRAAELFGDVLCFPCCIGDAAARHGNAVFLQQALGLIFVDVHGRSIRSES